MRWRETGWFGCVFTSLGETEMMHVTSLQLFCRKYQQTWEILCYITNTVAVPLDSYSQVIATSMRLWEHIVKTNWIFELSLKPPPYFRLNSVLNGGGFKRLWYCSIVVGSYASESRIHSCHRTTEWLVGLNSLYNFLLVSLSIYCVMTEIHISQHKAICIHTQGVVTPISTVLRAVTGDCNPIYGGCRCGLSIFYKRCHTVMVDFTTVMQSSEFH